MFNEYNFIKPSKFSKFLPNNTKVRRFQNNIKHNIYYQSLGIKNAIGGLEVKFG